MKITTKLTLAALAVMALGSNATAASFNCHKAATEIEHTICSDQWLSEKDGEMGRVYLRASKHANLRHEQRDWIKFRNRSCGANNDCLYDMTERRIAGLKKVLRRGNGSHTKHHGSVFSPTHGIVCDRKSGFCADSYGISLGYTKEYLGQKNYDIWTERTRGDFDTTSFGMSNRVYCDTNEGRCYDDKLKRNVDHYFTKVLFR
jgi:uncharacterized protein